MTPQEKIEEARKCLEDLQKELNIHLKLEGEMSRIKKVRKLIEQEEDNYMGGILAQGYCTKENGKKVVDPTLILAMVKHLLKEGYHKHDDIDCTKCRRTK